MFEITEVIAKENKDWVNINPSDNITKRLFQDYKKVLITIQNNDGINQYYLSEFRASNTSTDTLTVFIENYTLPLPAPIGNYIKTLSNKKLLRYINIWDYGFSAKSFNNDPMVSNSYIGYTPDIELKLDINISNIPMTALEDNLLFLVNGLVTVGEFKENSIILKDGQKLLDKYQSQRISLLDFTQLDGFTCLNFNEFDITILSTSTTESLIEIAHSNPIFVDVTPILAINKRLYISTQNYIVKDRYTINLRIRHADLLRECLGYTAEELGWIEPANLAGEGYQSETINIEAYLEHTLNYVLLINCDDLAIVKKPLIPTFKGKYKIMEEATGILFLEDGIIGDYIMTGKTFYGIELSTTHPLLKKPILDLVNLGRDPTVNLTDYSFNMDSSVAVLMDVYTL
jgi:hypothetical protein